MSLLSAHMEISPSLLPIDKNFPSYEKAIYDILYILVYYPLSFPVPISYNIILFGTF